MPEYQWVSPDLWAHQNENWVEELNALWTRIGRPLRTGEDWENCHSYSTQSVMVREDGQLVGYGRYVFDGINVTLYDLAADPAHSGRDFLEEIINALMQHANPHTPKFAFVVDTNFSGYEYYRWGFSQIDNTHLIVRYARLR